MSQQVDSSVESPEALMRMLDAQIAARRAQRREVSPHRGAMLAFSLLLIIGGGMAAFVFLFSTVANHVHREGGKPASQSTAGNQH